MIYVFANISANTNRRKISKEFAWQEASNDMRLDFIRYLVHEKIDIFRTITQLQKHEFELLLKIAKYWYDLFSGRNLALYVKYFLYLMYFKDSPSISFLKNFTILHVL